MKKNDIYVIGVDAGGTKTVAVLADLNGTRIRTVKTGPANPRNVGLEVAISNISEAILKATRRLKNARINSIVVGIPAVEEEYKFKKKLFKKELFKNKKVEKILNKGKIEFISDQIIAFRSGTDEKDGVILIAGTGSVCRGWKDKKDIKTSGWGWLGDEGSGFWIGQQAFQAVFKDLDKRGSKTKLTKLFFKKWKTKTKEDLACKIYGMDVIRTVSLISKITEEAALAGDKIARDILKRAGQELAISAIAVIKQLGLIKKRFPFVFVGSTIGSKIISSIVRKEIKKIAPKAEFIFPEKEPVFGALKLALEKS
jgi:N-acetylglucosamine kinase-like BadF-type ATPase